MLQISVENSKKNPESCSQNRACNIAHNGLALGAVADFGAKKFHLTTKVEAR
ncbi:MULTISPECIES: hypothetical protein [Empedobacter]|uniref:hypothetical protein n=1 Tax=Empedobacter TaxID=59734 RepID=UPI002575B66A|nr:MULTISPECIES: hypothetical protein [Empedobacter]MDM1043162.1 hypothetical protein [Empedobacter brevis]